MEMRRLIDVPRIFAWWSAAAVAGVLALTGCSGGSGSTPAGGANPALSQPTSTGATYEISGTVYGAASAGVLVTLNGPTVGSALTGSTGAYSFSGLPGGTYTVSAALAG